MEIKNKWTVTRWKGRIMGKRRGRGKSRNMHKGPKDKDNRGRGRTECKRWGVGRAGESNGRKTGANVFEQ